MITILTEDISMNNEHEDKTVKRPPGIKTDRLINLIKIFELYKLNRLELKKEGIVLEKHDWHIVVPTPVEVKLVGPDKIEADPRSAFYGESDDE